MIFRFRTEVLVLGHLKRLELVDHGVVLSGVDLVVALVLEDLDDGVDEVGAHLGLIFTSSLSWASRAWDRQVNGHGFISASQLGALADGDKFTILIGQ